MDLMESILTGKFAQARVPRGKLTGLIGNTPLRQIEAVVRRTYRIM